MKGRENLGKESITLFDNFYSLSFFLSGNFINSPSTVSILSIFFSNFSRKILVNCLILLVLYLAGVTKYKLFANAVLSYP